MTGASERRTGPALVRLQEAMAKDDRPTPFVGAGVSSAATGDARCASWRGLLLDGIEQCRQLYSPLPPGWVSRMKANLDSGDMITYMAVADEIWRRLTARNEGRNYATWLATTVGGLETTPEGWKLIRAIRGLGKTIVTTNYDSLLEAADQDADAGEHEPWPTCTWDDADWNKAGNKSRVVLHLHGLATMPDSVVLSSAHYERLGTNALNKIFTEYLFASRAFLYIGCGDGLNDPHIAPLIRKVIELLPLGKDEHFLLVRGRELRPFSAGILPERITPVVYGREFADLAGFLEKLGKCEDIDVSQDPDAYEQETEPTPADADQSDAAPPAGPHPGWLAARQLRTEPRITLLSLASPAQQRVQEALALLHRAARGADRVERRMALPADLDERPFAEQAIEHAQRASSLIGPAENLRSGVFQAAEAVSDTAADIAELSTPRYARHAAQLAPLVTAVAELEMQARTLMERVAQAHRVVQNRRDEIGRSYEDPSRALADALADLEEAHRDAVRMRDDLERLRGTTDTGTGQGRRRAAPQPSTSPSPPTRAAQGPDPAGAPAAPVSVTGLGTRLLRPAGTAAAGAGTDRQLYDPDPVPVVSDLARGTIVVVRVQGESMAGDDIHDGDYLIVDGQQSVYDGDIAVLEREGVGEREKIVKRVYFGEDEVRYRSSNPAYPAGTLTADDRAALVGKVTAVSRTIG